jgi:hypothetical protein
MSISARKRIGTGKPPDEDLNGWDFESTDDFFRGSAPKETRLNRLDRFIAYLDTWRPKCVIEICLAEYSWACQVKAWGELLKERGFEEVRRFKNGNSETYVRIYHRYK